MERWPVSRFIALLLNVVMFVNIMMGSAWTLLVIGHSEIESSSLHPDFENNQDLKVIRIAVKNSEDSGFLKINEHEFIYDGELYDIVRSVTENDTTLFYCINDSKEEKMLEQIRQCVAGHLPYVNPAKHSQGRFLKLFVQENLNNGQHEKKLPEVVVSFNLEKKANYSHTHLRKVYAPPEIFVS